MFGKPHEERKVEVGPKAAREDITPADAGNRLDLDPQEQPNFTDPERSDPQQTGPPGPTGDEIRTEDPEADDDARPAHTPKHRADVPEDR